MNTPTYTASELSERFNLQLHGDGATPITGVATLANAQTGQLSFLSNPRYQSQLATSQASVIVLHEKQAADAPCTALIAKDPYTAFAKIAALFDTAPISKPGIHPSAVIDPSANVDPSAHIGAFVSIGANSHIGAHSIIGPNCVIGADCTVGAHSELIAHVTLVVRVQLGEHVRIHPGAVLGADGFGLAMDAGHWIKVPQLGGVKLGDYCEIGANTCIDRGALEDTILEEDVRLDNQVQVGHNVYIGAHTAMAGCSAVSGSTKIGRYCLIGGAVGIAGHLEICDKVMVTGLSMVSSSIEEPGEYSSGIPVTDSKSWRKSVGRIRQLDTMARRLRALTSEKK